MLPVLALVAAAVLLGTPVAAAPAAGLQDVAAQDAAAQDVAAQDAGAAAEGAVAQTLAAAPALGAAAREVEDVDHEQGDPAAAGVAETLPVLPPELDTAEMQALRAEADAARAELADAARRLEETQRDVDAADERARRQADRAREAQAAVEEVADVIAGYVRGLYTRGTGTDLPSTLAAVSDGSGDLTGTVNGVGLMERLRAEQNDELDALLAVADRARRAEQAAEDARAEATGRRDDAAQQSAELARRAQEVGARLRVALEEAVAGVVAAADAYPNGLLPPEVLCSVGVDAHVLRCDAAAAFRQLSDAFAARFGVPLCLTDSYRSYDAQVSVFARKPGLAATPGTSNHGRGTAVDLCGPESEPGSEQHAWLLESSGATGWVLPDWARPGGSRPEPWHWEFGSAGPGSADASPGEAAPVAGPPAPPPAP